MITDQSMSLYVEWPRKLTTVFTLRVLFLQLVNTRRISGKGDWTMSGTLFSFRWRGICKLLIRNGCLIPWFKHRQWVIYGWISFIMCWKRHWRKRCGWKETKKDLCVVPLDHLLPRHIAIFGVTHQWWSAASQQFSLWSPFPTFHCERYIKERS